MPRWLALIALCSCLACTPTGPGDPPESADPAPLRVYLARHGRTAWNAEQRLQGTTDVPLDETGRRQSQELAGRLESVALDAVYASALARSRETASALAGRAPIESLDDLNERALGRFEGARYDGSDPGAIEEFRRRSADPDDTLDGGESARQHFERVRKAIAEIRRRHPSGQVLIVGHGGTNALILATLLDLTLEQTDAIHQANDEVYAIDVWPDRAPLLWKLIPPDGLADL